MISRVLAATILASSAVMAAAAVADDRWQLTDDPNARGDRSWTGQLEASLKPINPKKFVHAPDYSWVRLEGEFALPPLNNDGRTIRFGLRSSFSRCRLLFRSGDSRYRLAMANEMLVLCRLLGTPVKKDAERIARRLVDDRRAWYGYRDGNLDFRYQDGHVLVARGPQVLLAYPVEEAPREIVFEADETIDLRYFEVSDLAPLKWRTDELYPVGEQAVKPAGSFAWTRDENYKGREAQDPLTWVQSTDGPIEMFMATGGEGRRVVLDVGEPGPVLMTLKIAAMSEGANIIFHEESSIYYGCRIGRKDDQFVICNDPHNPGDVQTSLRGGWTVAFPLYLRLVRGLDFAQVDVSSDGQNWATRHSGNLGYRADQRPLRLELVLEARKKEQEHRIKIESISIEKLGITVDWVDQSLVERVPEFDEAVHQLHPRSTREERGELLPPVPGGADPTAWRTACAWAMLHQHLPFKAKDAAAVELIESAIIGGVPSPVIIADIDRLTRMIHPNVWENKDFYGNLLERLGERIILDSETATIPVWLDAWYALDRDVPRHQQSDQRYRPPDIVRYHLYNLHEQQKWAELRHEAARYVFYSRPNHENRLAHWMLHEAATHLPDTTVAVPMTTIHPLRISSDRELATLLGEFTAAAASGELDRACKLLTKGQFTGALLEVPGSDGLYRPAAKVMRNAIRESPALQPHLAEKYSMLGRIRLNRCLENEQYDLLDDFVTQFHGTQASREALILLANRDLSAGDFARAASRYKQGMTTAAGDKKAAIAAKLSLAESMMGRAPTSPLTTPVSLPAGTFTAAQFNAEIAALQQQQKHGEGRSRTVHKWPVPGAAAVTGLVDLPIYLGFSYTMNRFEDAVVLQQDEMIVAVDLDSRQIRWQHGTPQDPQRASPFTPSISEHYVITVKSDDTSNTLICLDLNTGAVVWERRLDGMVSSSPVYANGRVYILTHSRRSIAINRLNARTGRLEYSRSVLAEHGEQRTTTMKRLSVAKGRLLISDAGSVICCDEAGDIQWIQRMPYMPEAIERSLYEKIPHHGVSGPWRRNQTMQSSDHHLFVDDDVVVCSPGSPYLSRVDLGGGSRQWQILRPDRKLWMGRAGNHMLLCNRESIQALNSTDGSLLWQHSLALNAAVGYSDGDDHLLAVRLDRVDSPDKPPSPQQERWAQWISVGSGELVKEVAIPLNGRDVWGVQRLWAHQGKAYMLSAAADANNIENAKARISVLESGQ